jgi:hypothetical protein
VGKNSKVFVLDSCFALFVSTKSELKIQLFVTVKLLSRGELKAGTIRFDFNSVFFPGQMLMVMRVF